MTRTVWTIINTTPDSFFEGSRAMSEHKIAEKANQAIQEGASVIDLGGMSTRPGHEQVSADEEFRRLDMAFGAIRGLYAQTPISIDTFRSEVVERLYEKYGQFTVNDISGGESDDRMFETLGERGLPYVMMSQGATMGDICRLFDRNIPRAEACGVSEIILDPGFGFGKTLEQNFEVLARMDVLKKYEHPILVGISRKSMIHKTLSITPQEALNGTTALHFEALTKGADILRVHDTREAIQTIKLYETYIDHAK